MRIGQKRTLRDKWRLTSLSNKIITLATAVIAFSGILTFGAALFQWLEMRGAGKQTDRIIAADERLATAMEDSVKEADKSLNATITQNQLDQRAWVGPSDIKLNEMKAPNSISAVITLVNTGKTPAIKCKVNYLIHASDTPLNIDQYMRHPVEPAAKTHPNFTLFPNGKITLVPATGTTDELGIQNVRNGKKSLYIFGQIEYFDVFGKPHLTKFCGQYDPRTDGIATCNSYAYID